jgi:outer membrane protein OmpA-like peptidoglycan-associated protein
VRGTAPGPQDPHSAEPLKDTGPTVFQGHFHQRRSRGKALPITVGLIGLALLGGVQQGPLRAGIERDLTVRARQALDEAGLASIGVDTTGRDIRLTGRVDSAAERTRAVTVVRDVTGVRRAQDDLSGPGGPNPAAPTGDETPRSSAQASGTPSGDTLAPTRISARISANRVTLGGVLTDDATRTQVLNDVARVLPGVPLLDRLTLDPDAGSAGLTHLPAVLSALGPDAEATIELSGGTLVLAGGVPFEENRTSALAAAAVVTGDAAAVSDQLRVDPRTTVRCQLRDVPTITFRNAYSTLSPSRLDSVHQVAQILREHPEVRVQVRGYTDDVGDADINYSLSYARARTVYRELQRLGIPASQMEFRGLGEKDPAVPNTSTSNRAANRRVEFRVLF